MLKRSLIARGAAYVLAAAALCARPGAAHAKLGIVDRVSNTTVVSTIKPKPVAGVDVIQKSLIRQVPADLILESFEVKELAGNQFALHAVLRNGDHFPLFRYDTYPGGGSLVLHRTSGGTKLNAPQPGGWSLFGISSPDPGADFSIPIPALSNNQSIEINATTTGRAIFSAYTVGVTDADMSNNRREVNKLISHAIPLNASTVSLALGSTLGSVQMRLDRDDTFVKVPGIMEMHTTIPTQSTGVIVGAVRYYVHDINLNNVSLDVADRSLIANLDFEQNEDEIIGYLHTWIDDSDPAVPNINASPMQISVKLPLGYDPSNQTFTYQDAQVNVNANWTFNGPLGWGIMGWAQNILLPDINGKIKSQGESLFNNFDFRQMLQYRLNQKLHALTAGGRITGVNFDDPSQPVIYAELPW
jgi:hypothetical protein